MSDITIVQLYPDELGVAGDRGNVMAVTARLERAGHSVNVVEHSAGSKLPKQADFVIVGNGPLSAMRNVYDDLTSIGPALQKLITDGVPVFAYGSGAELLGHSITLLDGSVLDGLGIFPFRTERVELRKVGYVLAETAVGEIVGFEDNASFWHLESDAKPFGTLIEGGGNGEGNGEGVLAGSSIATQIGGPVLPLNPALTDYLIRTVATRSGFDYATGQAHADLDSYAARAREVIISKAKHVFSRI